MRMVGEIMAGMERDCEIELRNVLHFGSLNNVMMSVFGKRYEFRGDVDDDDDGMELEGLVREGYELLGIFNWADHFPFLGWLDLQGVRKRSKRLVARVNGFVGKIIDEHRMKRANKYELVDDDDDHHNSHDFVDVLLDLEKESSLSDSDMIAVLWVILLFYY